MNSPARFLVNQAVSPVAALVIAFLLFSQAGRAQDLLAELTEKGVSFSQTVQVPMQKPSLAGKLTDEELAAAKKRLAGNDDWDRFTRDSVVAPVTIKLVYVTDSEGERVGHNVHSSFVVHAKLESIVDKDLMEQMFGKAGSSSSESGLQFTELTSEELAAAGIETPTAPEREEPSALHKTIFSQVEFVLLEKIRLRGVMRIERTQTPDSTTIAWRLEPQFGKSTIRQATWERLGEAEATPKPYSGWAGYVSVTRLDEPSEMVMVESRMLLHEMPEWFNASNFVRSKLPMAIQESARNFRRKLKAR